MTEEQIERTVERKFNELDRRFIKGSMTQTEYDREVSILDKWAHQQYDAQR